MRELGLRYKGKRCPFRFKNPRFEESLDFMSNDTVVWVKKRDADWLISNNPRMFEIMSERGKVKGSGQIEQVVKVNPVIIATKPEIEAEPVEETQKEIAYHRYMKKDDVIKALTELKQDFNPDDRRHALLRKLKYALK